MRPRRWTRPAPCRTRRWIASSRPRDAELNFNHAARQAYIGPGAALIAAEGDWLVNLKTVRRPLEQFVTEVK